MPFWPPFSMAGKRFIKNTSGHRIKLTKQLILIYIKPSPSTLAQPLLKRFTALDRADLYIPCHRSGKWLTIVVMFVVELCWW
jgi:hypothetical protein